MQRVLVTGATGFIGYEVARQLSDRGFRPRLMVRRPERGDLLSGLDAELIHGDLTRPSSLVRAVQGVDTIDTRPTHKHGVKRRVKRELLTSSSRSHCQ